MIAFSTFQNLDPAAAPERMYLALAAAGRTSVTFYGPSALDAQNKARAWLEAERAKAETARIRTRRPAKPEARP